MLETAWLPFFMPTNKGFPDVHVFGNNPPSGKQLLNGHESNINDLLARVKLLELILSADVTGNPYYVTFNTLTDVVVSSGIWNEADGRIEF